MAPKKPVVTKSRLRKNKRAPAAFIRTQTKSAADDVLDVGFWNRIKTAAAPTMPHPFLAELATFPLALGAMGAGLGNFVDTEDAVKRFALTAGLMGLGIALGRGAGAKFLPRASKSTRGMMSGGGLSAGSMASDVILPEMGYEPIIDDFHY